MAENKTAARKFEYQTTKLITETNSWELKKLGKDGWELVAISHESNLGIRYTMFWKREIFN